MFIFIFEICDLYLCHYIIKIINLVFTCATGGIASTTFTAIAVSIRPTQEEIDEENLIKVKKKY